MNFMAILMALFLLIGDVELHGHFICSSVYLSGAMASYLWRKYADYLYNRWEKTILWDFVEPYRRPKSFTPLVAIYTAAFYTGVVGAAITEQLHKEKYWEEHPGENVPLMKPIFYGGPWRVVRGEAVK